MTKSHVNSAKHQDRKTKLAKQKLHQKDIASRLEDYNSSTHLVGETLPADQQVFRVKVLQTFLSSGVPLNKLDAFKPLLEENGFRLTDIRNMSDLIPFLRDEEMKRIRSEISSRPVSVVFDGTTRFGEALAIVVQYVTDDFQIKQKLAKAQMLSKSMTGEQIARELISVLSVGYGVPSDFLLGAMRDRASSNNVAMDTVRIIYPSVVDIGCFSHTIDHVGDKFNTPTLTQFGSKWINLFSHSPKCKMLWKTLTGKSMPTYSATRWWSKWEVYKHMMLYFKDILTFLTENEDVGPALRPQLLAVLNNIQTSSMVQIELAAVVDCGEQFVKGCYTLEGDGALAFTAHEEVQKIQASIAAQHYPNVQALAPRLTGQAVDHPASQQWIIYAKNCCNPGIQYFERQLATSLRNSMDVFKAARLFNPAKVNFLQPTADSTRTAFGYLPFLPANDVDSLLEEQPQYMARAHDTAAGVDIMEWWRLNANALPTGLPQPRR